MFQLFNAQGGGFYWTFQAGNNEPLCTSETYTTKASALNGIESVKRNVPNARIDDQS